MRKGKLKPFDLIIKECKTYSHASFSHYWKFYYNDRYGNEVSLGFRDFYKSYFNTEVTIRPKYNRKKQIIRDRVEVVAKNGNLIMDTMKCWFQYFYEDNTPTSYYVSDPLFEEEEMFVKSEKLSDLSWDELFDL